mgnify:CR=1 FL=1
MESSETQKGGGGNLKKPIGQSILLQYNSAELERNLLGLWFVSKSKIQL